MGQERAFLLSKVGEMAILYCPFCYGSDDVGEWGELLAAVPLEKAELVLKLSIQRRIDFREDDRSSKNHGKR